MALKRLMANEWRRSTAQKRGGAQPHLPLDTTDAERRYGGEPVAALAADDIYERRWAMTMLDQALDQLGAEFSAEARNAEFECLKRWLGAERGAFPMATWPRLSAIARAPRAWRCIVFRKRFRQLFKMAIASTVAEGEDVDEELRGLVAVLSRA